MLNTFATQWSKMQRYVTFYIENLHRYYYLQQLWKFNLFTYVNCIHGVKYLYNIGSPASLLCSHEQDLNPKENAKLVIFSFR